MAGKTGNIDVCAIQFERKQTVVNVNIFPIRNVMANGASRPKLSVMGVILGMTGNTIRRDPSKLSGVGMAFFAGHTDMLSFQFEGGKIMIKLEIIAPTRRVVTIATGQTITSLMGVIFLVATFAGGRGGF